jgi:hypothetical protein
MKEKSCDNCVHWEVCKHIDSSITRLAMCKLGKFKDYIPLYKFLAKSCDCYKKA